ncbi:MAG TPA: prepilin-type N-terminal cleavage/methylation domain-containing protein [Terriglobales bacterium]|nr:prepilin-type N-terminal cleavage/methylation domain-containing protein [Terriglobales bacterium]
MRNRTRQRGFTMIELMIVIVIILVVAAMAIPSVMSAMYNIRLRSSGSEVAGLMQSGRMRAIRDNKTYPLNCTPQPLNQCVTLFVDLSGTGTGAYQAGASVVELPGTVRFSLGGFPAIPPATLGFIPAVNQQIYFNTRGLPCVMGGGGVCTTSGFVFYFQDQRPLGTNGYSAVAVTPAGRVRVYSYNVTNGWFQS